MLTTSPNRLPEVLESLRHPTPEALAGALPQVAADKNDEIGQLANDFNVILRTSIETSLEHSQRQANTMTNLLVNLGRRNQSLIDRQLELIDVLESSEENPDLLESLFKLDHMVTRQRRNAESLLILAGSSRTRSWSASVPLSDVIRGAISEVADLSRVRFEVQPGNDLRLSGQYAVDLSHLLAELIENATLFSNPSTVVTIRVQRGPQQFRVWVIDSGVGMSEEELVSANQIVTLPPMIEELATDRVGFQVVGRLAQRFGVRVRIQNNPSGGVAASVDLPASMFDALNHDQPVVAEAESAIRAATHDGESQASLPAASTPGSDGGSAAPAPAAPPAAEAPTKKVNGSSVRSGRQSRTGAPAPAMRFDESVIPQALRPAAPAKPVKEGELPRRANRAAEVAPAIIPRLAPTPAAVEPSKPSEMTAAGLPRRGQLNGTFGAAGSNVVRRLPESAVHADGTDAERRAKMMKLFTQGVDAGRDDEHSKDGDAS
jgi:anti-sigma regulatory factor (Ser/Thr protein kinase)